MDKKKGISLTIIAILVFVLSVVGATYAYWSITKSQNDDNRIAGACLDYTFQEDSSAVVIENAWPLTNWEGMNLTPYVFSIKNNCDEPLDYDIYLDKLSSSTMPDSSISLIFDYGIFDLYDNFDDVEFTENGVSERKKLADDTVLGNSTNTHYLRVWIDEDSTSEDQGKKFDSKVTISAGQGIEKYYTPQECFKYTIANGEASIDGYVDGFDSSICTRNLVVPYEIEDNGTKYNVTSINDNSFNVANVPDGLESIELPRTVKIINNLAFSAIMPTRVILKDGLEQIIGNNFNGKNSSVYSDLEFIMFPNTVETIGMIRFTHLQNLIIPDNVTSFFGTMNFSNNKIENFKISSNTELTELPTSFLGANEIQSVDIPSNITKIGNGAFAGNPIKSITLHEGLQEIGNSAFSNYNTSFVLNSPYKGVYNSYVVNIPSTVTKIGDKLSPAFYFDSSNKGTLNFVGTPSIDFANVYATNANITCNGVPCSN